MSSNSMEEASIKRNHHNTQEPMLLIVVNHCNCIFLLLFMKQLSNREYNYLLALLRLISYPMIILHFSPVRNLLPFLLVIAFLPATFITDSSSTCESVGLIPVLIVYQVLHACILWSIKVLGGHNGSMDTIIRS